MSLAVLDHTNRWQRSFISGCNEAFDRGDQFGYGAETAAADDLAADDEENTSTREPPG